MHSDIEREITDNSSGCAARSRQPLLWSVRTFPKFPIIYEGCRPQAVA
jgi:hypothetical protein